MTNSTQIMVDMRKQMFLAWERMSQDMKECRIHTYFLIKTYIMTTIQNSSAKVMQIKAMMYLSHAVHYKLPNRGSHHLL
jgi:hypothetical protein